jgi:hypothetical protein
MGKLVAASPLLVLAFLVGCGGDSNVGSVTGTVTLDGQPLPDAFVKFSGKKGGSPSMGRTDASGNYSLSRNRDTMGADLGEHSVSISTYQAGDPDSDPPVAAAPEKVPTKYNIATELKANVVGGKNVTNFDLKSDGEILQPDKT